MDHAKELYRAADTALPGTSEETMKEIRKALKYKIDPPPLRLVPQDDKGRKYTIAESEGQIHTFLNVGDIYSIKKKNGEEYKGEFMTALDTN
jgi:hypothetical protein